MKHIVHIYGPCGSGTSTLGREIGRRLRFRFLDTDDFFWLPTDPQYTQKRPLEERLALLEEELLRALRESVGDGEILQTSFAAAEEDGLLTVTLQAECTEEIGRFVPRENLTQEIEADS